MNEPYSAEDPATQELICWKVWGGNGHTEVPISIPGLRGRLYSCPCESDRGGDLYYLSACGSGALARLCLADVTGHGPLVATFSAWLEEVFSAHIHRASPSVVLKEVNRRAATRGLEVMSTAVCLSYNSLNGRLAYCNAGHPPVRLCRAGSDLWQPLSLDDEEAQGLANVPLAVDDGAEYTVGRIQLKPGDRLLVHTDGLTEAHDGDMNQLSTRLWNEGTLPGSSASVEAIADSVLSAYRSHTGGSPDTEDDITFMVFEVLPYQQGNRYSLLVKNNVQRLKRAWQGK